MNCRFVSGLLTLLGALSAIQFASAAERAAYLVYIGTYTGPKSKGIYAYRLDAKSGALESLGLAAETLSPSFLAIHPKEKFLYAANEVETLAGKRSGAVSSFSIDPKSGKLTFLNQQPSGGAGPCHLSVDHSGQFVFVANYGGGSIASYPIKSDGSLGEAASFIQHKGSSVNRQRQEGPHAHCIAADPGNKLILAADLGLDKILVYKLDAASGRLTENDPPFGSLPTGSGPRHFSFTSNGKFCYVINEIKSTLTAFAYDRSSGDLKELQTVSTLPPDADPKKNSTAEIEVHPSGKFVYGSNRGHDSIAVFSIDSKSGKLTLVQHQLTGGKVPRSFGIDPSGRFLLAANQDSDNVVVFRIDPRSGQLTASGQEGHVGSPVCVKFVTIK